MMLLPRTIKIWLPPGYNNNDSNENEIFNNNIRQQQQRHPVLYVHDGQNAMEDEDSWTGASWRLMGALTRLADHQLIGNNILPIVVLLPSADGDLLPGVRRRHLEYGDINFPFAQAHADFVANTVKPLIDDRFRTDPSPEHNFVMGSSLGGQASLHLMMRHPDKFGGAACLSPAFMPAMLDYVASTKGQDILRNKNGGCPKKIYIDIGGDMPSSGKSKDDDTFVRVSPIDVLDHLTPVHGWNPGYFWLDTQLQRQVTAMKKLLDKGGIEYQFRQYPGARHNERAWALRIDKPLQHLFSSNSDKRP
ncbi:alpha/beta-hydrolase [Fragilariopsis cylindrus CCMP1102]|uniref:Alpha/beta-hydrolase n=1 Tax=Fragilariopsis cylindrus CCMP1102 TaxID=635003 RepID=A0A1E7FXP0_9STRA|nr:alpha/beta-hydrolase [Fragilariopsis cylindrus CCMP1102]|eukprot:OEU22919.1 alpha/beta-hydrolase [Fragilariopsis cylindrus CCMP1102]